MLSFQNAVQSLGEGTKKWFKCISASLASIILFTFYGCDASELLQENTLLVDSLGTERITGDSLLAIKNQLTSTIDSLQQTLDTRIHMNDSLTGEVANIAQQSAHLLASNNYIDSLLQATIAQNDSLQAVIQAVQEGTHTSTTANWSYLLYLIWIPIVIFTLKFAIKGVKKSIKDYGEKGAIGDLVKAGIPKSIAIGGVKWWAGGALWAAILEALKLILEKKE